MGIPSSRKPATVVIRDLALACAFSAAGWNPDLENRNGTVFFIFNGDPEKLKNLEASFWNGTLLLPARDLLLHQKTLKNRLYQLKEQGR